MKNLPPLETLLSRLLSKRKAISGFGLCVFASFLIFTLLYVGGEESAVGVDSSPSLLLWIFSVSPAARENQTLWPSADLKPEILRENIGGMGSVEYPLNGSPRKKGTQVKSPVEKSQRRIGGNVTASNATSVEASNPPCKSTQGSIDCDAKSGESKDSSDEGNGRKIDGNKHVGKVRSWLDGDCDIFAGRWVRDDSKPLYPPSSCPYIDPDFNCHDNGRPDDDFLTWRWQPNDCEIPSLNASDFLRRLKNQRLIFVGDSLNRNMWESLVCILRQAVKDKNRVYEMSGRRQFKTSGYYSFIFKDYNCSVDFVRSPFLVKEVFNSSHVSESDRLRLDVVDETTSAYRTADIVVFNTGHWWTHEKTSKGVNYYQEGDRVYTILDVTEAYKKALLTWGRWLDGNIDPAKTQVIFRGYSLTHFSGGQWNSGGQCHKETEPISNENFTRQHPEKMKILEQVLKRIKTPVTYLNVTRLTDYRKDAHPSIYRPTPSTLQVNAQKPQDCSHWCLPGVPDTWNELLYASLLKSGRGSWGPH